MAAAYPVEGRGRQHEGQNDGNLLLEPGKITTRAGLPEELIRKLLFVEDYYFAMESGLFLEAAISFFNEF